MAGEVESNDGQLFAGVRFVLFGFDSVSEALVMSYIGFTFSLLPIFAFDSSSLRSSLSLLILD